MDWRPTRRNLLEGVCEPCGAVMGACLRGKEVLSGRAEWSAWKGGLAIDKSYSLDFLNLPTARVGCGAPMIVIQERKESMAWTTPTLVEICIGLEINGYLPAEF